MSEDDGQGGAEEPDGIWDVDLVATLGAPVLAELLVEFAERDDGIARELRLRLAAADEDVDSLVAAIAAELDSIASDREWYGYEQSFDFARDMERLRLSIVESLLPRDPRATAMLLGRFVRLDGLNRPGFAGGWLV